MSSDFGLGNIFGSITSKKGKTIKFNKLDGNHDHQISESEFNFAKRLYNVNVEFEYLDKNSDGIIDDQEFQTLEQEAEMQKALNKLQQEISASLPPIDRDYIPQIVDAIKDFTQNFLATNIDCENIVELYKTELKAFYEEYMDSEEMQSRPSIILDNAIDVVYTEFVATLDSDLVQDGRLSKKIGQLLEKVGEDFVLKNPDKANIDDITEYLRNYLNTSDRQKLQSAVDAFNESTSGYGDYISSNEFGKLKEDARELLQEAVDLGIVVTLKGTKIMTTQAINSALNKFRSDEGNELLAAMQEIIANLSDTPKIDQLITEQRETINREAQIQESVDTINNYSNTIANLESELAGTGAELTEFNRLFKENTLYVTFNKVSIPTEYTAYKNAIEELKQAINEIKPKIENYKNLANRATTPEKAKEYQELALAEYTKLQGFIDSFRNAQRQFRIKMREYATSSTNQSNKIINNANNFTAYELVTTDNNSRNPQTNASSSVSDSRNPQTNASSSASGSSNKYYGHRPV